MKALGIPPAWTEVWICPVSEGHLQATGRDAKGRKQYRYHPRWRARREQTKYAQMCAFGEALPVIRRQVEHDLALPSMPRAKVLATVLRLLEITLIRVGNEAYARVNHSFGLTTLRDQHVDITGATLRTIDSADVNAYLRQITGQDFTTKDFRTWAGSVLALEALQACGACESWTQGRTHVAQVIKTVASRIGMADGRVTPAGTCA
jgi:DNA topoisomerase-1